MLAEVSRRIKAWDKLPPELFEKLVTAITTWPKSGAKAKLLEKLTQIKKDGRQRTLVGELIDSLGESPTHAVLSREKDDRAKLYSKTVKSLRCAADALDGLAVIDRESETTARLASGEAGSEPWRTMGEQKSSLAVELRQHASKLDGEREGVQRGYRLRQLGVRADCTDAHANAEGLSLLRSIFDLSYNELALLVEAAHQAWKRETIDVSGEAVKKAIAGFRKRTHNLAQSADQQT